MKRKYKWQALAGVRQSITTLAPVRRRYESAGQLLLSVCDGQIFPADVYLVGTCNRSLQNHDAFVVAIKSDFYSTAMILLRVQLDSLLRVIGLLSCEDPHATAQAVLNGRALRKMKNRDGVQMTDANLVKIFVEMASSNAVIEHIYELTSGYVHLSGAAMEHVLKKTQLASTGEHRFFIGATEPEVPAVAKVQLVNAFRRVSDALMDAFASWAEVRMEFGNALDLAKVYGPRSD